MNGNGSSPAGGPRAHLVVFALLEGGWYASMAAMFAGFPVLLVASLHLRWPPAVSVWAAAMMAMLLLSLRVRGREGAPGRLLGREEAPGLRALVDEARRVAGIGPVGEIRVTALPNVGVTRVFRGGILYCRPVKVLLVGLPCLRALTVPELASILVHEFAHFLGQDVHRGERLAVIDARVGNLQAAFERTGPLRWLSPVYLWARAYGAFFTVATARIRRRQEILADALAARACTAPVYGRALIKAAAVRRLFFRMAGRRLLAGIRKGEPPRNLFLETRDAIRGLHPDDRRRVMREVREAPEAALSTHPPLAERLERIGRLWVPRRRRREGRASALVPGLAALEEELTPAASRVVMAALVLRARRSGREPAAVIAGRERPDPDPGPGAAGAATLSLVPA